jgi:hypothetical protein
MDPKQKDHKENTAANCVRIPTPQVYHKSPDLVQAQRGLQIAVSILVLSILINMIMFIRIDQLQVKIQKMEELTTIENEKVLESIDQIFQPDPAIDKEPLYDTMPVCSTKATFKSWMDYRKITDESTRQWKYRNLATTDENGFRRIDDYYMVAMAKMYGPVGTKYFITFSGGASIYAMMGDLKGGTSCQHSDTSMLEFIIDIDTLLPKVRSSGNANKVFEGTITEIRVIK